MWAYVDETGNTGQNLFDPNQPIYITAALMTRSNFDLTERAKIERIANSVGESVLHANKLGVSKINDISPQLKKIFRRCDAKFFVSRLEKKYLIATKVIDTYFDQGENLAVPWHVYWLRPMRLMLTFKLASLVLTEEIAVCVWKSLNAKSEQSSKKYFVRGAELMLAGVECLPDARSRQIVEEALQWAIRNPENFDTFSRDKVHRYFHSPNFVAFTNLMDGIEKTSKKWSRKVREVVHDEQSQFEKSFQVWHELMSKPHLASAEPLLWPGDDEPIPVSFAPGSRFRTASEETSVGLQMVDILIWLFKRVFEGKEIGENSRTLLNAVLKRAYQHDFSFIGVGDKTEKSVRQMMETSMSEDQLAQSKEIFEKQESIRREAIRQYELKKLGLLPKN